jgi:hypothetical protein
MALAGSVEGDGATAGRCAADDHRTSGSNLIGRPCGRAAEAHRRHAKRHCAADRPVPIAVSVCVLGRKRSTYLGRRWSAQTISLLSRADFEGLLDGEHMSGLAHPRLLGAGLARLGLEDVRAFLVVDDFQSGRKRNIQYNVMIFNITLSSIRHRGHAILTAARCG